MKKWIALLAVLPIVGCGSENDELPKGDPAEVAEARDLIDTLVATGGIIFSPEAVADPTEMFKNAEQQLENWETDFPEKILLSNFLQFKEKQHRGQEQALEVYYDALNHDSQDELNKLAEYLSNDETLTSLMKEAFDLELESPDQESGLHELLELRILVNARVLELLEEEKEWIEREFTEAEVTMYTRSMKLQMEIAQAIVGASDALEEMEKAQKGWK